MTSGKWDKGVIWKALKYKPHVGQIDIHRSPHRHRVDVAGRRFGKSVVGGHELTIEALRSYALRSQLEEQGKRRDFWIVGPEYTDSEKEFRVVYDDCKRLQVPFDKPGTYNNPESGEMVISLWGGRFFIHAKSSKYPTTLVGEGLAGVIMAEAAKMKELVWTKFIRPTLADTRGWSLWLTTPEGKNWVYGIWQRGLDPNQPDWISWRSPSWLNNYVYPKGATPEGMSLLREAIGHGVLTPEVRRASGVDAEVIDMMLEMTEARFNQEIGAEFTDFVGQVFAEFDEEVHVRDLEYNPRWPLYACCDYGWTNPFVWLLVQVDIWDNVSVIGEYRTVQTDINDIARDLKHWRNGLSSNAKMFYPDPEAPGDSAVLTKELRMPHATNTGGELKFRLEYIRQWLRPVPAHVPLEQREPKLLIDRSCKHLIYEMGEYRFPDTKEEQSKESPENPMKKDDHGPEALGRFFRGYFGAMGQETTRGRARVSKANVHT